MRPYYQYTPLKNFLGGVYTELAKSGTHAKGLQTEYLVEMSKHMSPISALELINKLEVDTFTIDFHFKQIFPRLPLWHRFLVAIGKEERLPDGTYLLLTTKDESLLNLSLSVKVDEDRKMLIEPEITEQIKYYVVTKIG